MEILNWISSLGTLFSGIAALVMLIFIYKQIKDVKEDILNHTYQSIYEQIVDLDRFFFEHPEYKLFFYRNKDFSEVDELEKEKLLSIAEMLIDIFQCIYFQKNNIRKSTFEAQSIWIGDMYNNSPIIREYLNQKNIDIWYAQEFHQYLIECGKKLIEIESTKAQPITKNIVHLADSAKNKVDKPLELVPLIPVILCH